jgi:hypothetical protein
VNPIGGAGFNSEVFLERSKLMLILLLIILLVLAVGSAPAWPYSRGWGYYPSGGLGTVLLILLDPHLLGII